MRAVEQIGLLAAGLLFAPGGFAGQETDIFIDGFESPRAEITGFRLTNLDLRDPHIFVQVLLACVDVTAEFNSEVQRVFDSDEDGNGFLDLSFVLGMRPLDQSGNPAELDFYNAECISPVAGTSCTPAPMDPILSTTGYQATADPICLDTVPGTIRPYSPGVTLPTSPCFSSDPATLSLPLLGTSIPLWDARLGATFVNQPADQMINGLLYGFFRESDADLVILPPEIPLIGGQSLAALLRGGEGNCASGSDQDIHMAETGWWMYFNFQAVQVPFTP